MSIAGAASPVGRSICHLLASQGANLAITDSCKGEGQDLCLELQKAGNGGSLLFAVVGHNDADKLSTFIRNASKSLKRLDGLVNCAYTLHEVSGHREGKISRLKEYSRRTCCI